MGKGEITGKVETVFRLQINESAKGVRRTRQRLGLRQPSAAFAPQIQNCGE
jgi:hypothetical protein